MINQSYSFFFYRKNFSMKLPPKEYISMCLQYVKYLFVYFKNIYVFSTKHDIERNFTNILYIPIGWCIFVLSCHYKLFNVFSGRI